ncbi:HupE/UreJ family protein [Nannocystis sp.]|uniref:HupE/UreJ family protein n=1 Tax=Nannocystis sp. TaxID=1962667 RepID=UPI0024227FF6|nr:HupE/UreJ family protein [Nannocystis sp.]MBK7826977.1 HupE/UreJ family protein [Nannocystis sp.]MBK9756000.1 HupE/UreJ family protein [Nannocystis sp.]
MYTVHGREVTGELTFARAELLGLVPALDVDEDGALTDAELSSGTGALQPVAAGVVLVGDDRPCAGELIDAALTEEDGARMRMRFTCPGEPRRLAVSLPVLEQLKPGHRHLAQLARVDGEVFADLVLHRRAATASAEVPVDAMAPVARPAPSVRAYFEIGVEHILIGTDHLVFLLGLVVVGGRLRSLIAVVTAFTIGHSLSLALATLGVWRPDPGFVEPAIALSIAYVGVENFLVADAAGRWRITLPFGFIHGFGFAGVLAEIGVPDGSVGAALLLFNLGVEAGQLLVLALVLPLLAWLGARPAYQRARGPRWISAAIVVAGLFWFIQRVGFAQ